MKITRPAEEVEVCDCCGRDGYLETCVVCGGKYCVLCHSVIPGCIHGMDVCKRCAYEDEVKDIAKSYAPDFKEIIRARDKELRALRRKIKARRKNNVGS